MQQLKQRYLLANSPCPPDFQAERNQQFEKLIVLISHTERSKWLSTGFNCGPMIESYKEVYGFTSQQLQTVLMLLINIAFGEKGLSTDIRAYILRLLNTLAQYQIKITDNFTLNNRKLLKYLWSLVEEGLEGNLKHSDPFIQDLSKFTLYFSKFGQDIIEEALSMAIRCNQIRYLAIFMRSIKKEASALRLLTQLFSDNNLWDRDSSWFYILGQIVKKFPQLDYSKYYQTIMQQVIRSFTTIINADNEQAYKKLTVSDGYLQIPCVFKSVALIMAFLLLPSDQPQHVFIKACIERIFSIVGGSLDNVNPPDYLSDILTFLKAFSRFYLVRYRAERGLCKLFNEDTLDDINQPPTDQKMMIDQEVQIFFDSLWAQIIPRLIYFEDPEECKPSKIITQLCMYKPEVFLQLSLNSILNVVGRQDPTFISFHGSKITVLFLQEYIMLEQPRHLPVYFQCIEKMINHLQILGVPQNIDILELFFRSFLFLTNQQLNQYYIQTMINDVISMMLDILEPMSISLDDADQDQAELYIDFANIFLPFFVRLDENQIQTFQEKFIFRLANQVPEHQQGYQYLAIALTFVDQNFAGKVFKFLKKKLVTSDKMDEKEIQWQFLPERKGSLLISNQKVLKWYGTLIQCIFQYHPKNVVKHFPQIETIVIFLFRQWQNQTYLELGLDIIYNVILCLCKAHFSWKQFSKKENWDYRTLNIQYQQMTTEEKELIEYIYETYFVKIKEYLEHKYGENLSKEGAESKILGDFQTYHEQNQNSDVIRIRRRNLKLVDYILMPRLLEAEQNYDRKIIFRCLSIQYTVMSALMYKVPFHPKLDNNIGDFFTEQKFVNLRVNTCKYLEWVLQLIGQYGLFADDQCVRVFNFFWRESHDEVCYSSAIQATNDKLSPYYYSQIHRKKELLHGAYLIVNEAYLTHMQRLEFHLINTPTAHLNNERYLESNFILGLCPAYEPSLHSFFPSYVEVHQYHRELMAILRYHLTASNSNSYIYKYLKEEDQATKERYCTAVKLLVVALKKLVNVFTDKCCMRDQFIRNTVFQIIGLYKLFPKKQEKSLIFEIIYLLLVFAFDGNSCQQVKQYSLKRFWELKLSQSPQVEQYQIAKIKEGVNIRKVIEGIQNEENQVLTQVDMCRSLKLTRSCSFQHDAQLQRQLQRAVNYLLNKLEENISSLQKDAGIYLLLLLLYSNILDIQNPLMGKIMTLLSKLCQKSYSELFEMSKTGFFHMINRFNYHKRHKIQAKNVPVKRSWEEFLRFKFIGGEKVDYNNIKVEKFQQNFYPSENLLLYSYSQLASDPALETYENEKVLLTILEDEEGMYKFLKNCSLDPELKQSDQQENSLIVSEENFKSVSAGAHKLMHFIWDCNPVKTPLFMGILQRYSSSPLNFYNRMFRKIIRMSTNRTKEVCYSLANKLRVAEEQEMIRLSIYINCELFTRNPEHPSNQPFLDYLGQCTKQNFDYVLMGLYGIFTSNFVRAEKSYEVVLKRLRELKGASRLRHLEVSNTYIVGQGRFARKAALEMHEMIMKGIEEGGDEISDAIVSIITECMVQAINLKKAGEWVNQSVQSLVADQRLFILNEHVGYNGENILIKMLEQLLRQAKEEDEHSQGSKLKIYSPITRKILASINIYRFNAYFHKLLSNLLFYVMERPQSTSDDNSDMAVMVQLCDSQYPEDIYQQLLEKLIPMTDCTPYVVKKKLVFLQGMVINRFFRLNKVDIPPLLERNEKSLTLEYIITLSNILRLMTSSQLTEQAERILKITKKRPMHETYTLVAILMASGVRQFEWKQKILRDLVKHKKQKLVKESISQWWKGKSPQTQLEHRLAELVRNFDNPYSYFA